MSSSDENLLLVDNKEVKAVLWWMLYSGFAGPGNQGKLRG
jgi:hypothetical protein